MKILAVTLAVVLVIGAVVLGYGYWAISGGPSLGPAPRKTPAPEGFDAAAFPDIAQLASTGAVSVVDLGEFGDYFEHYHLPELKVTYFILFSGDAQRVTVFVDREGAVFGTITRGPDSFPMGRYFVDLDGSYEVSADAVGDFRPHEVIEGPVPEADLTRLVAESSHYRSYSWRDTDRDSADYAAKRDTHVMRHEGVWKKLVMAAEYHEWKGTVFDGLDTQYSVGETVLPEDATRFFGGKYTLRLTHFDQQEYIRKRGAPMGSTTGQGTPAQWTGTGYYTLTAGDAALRFSIPNDRQILSGFGPVYLTLEGGSDLDFVVLKHHGRGQDQDVFVISAP